MNKKPNIEFDSLGTEEYHQKINSRVKGCANEREVAKWLTRWTQLPFARVPSSGGLRWKNSPDTIGDLVCQDRDEYFPFCIETKHLKTLTIKEKLSRVSRIFSIWYQAQRDSIRAKKLPILILRQNGMPKGHFYIFVDARIKDLLSVKEVSWGISVDDTYLYGYESETFITEDFNSLVEKIEASEYPEIRKR